MLQSRTKEMMRFNPPDAMIICDIETPPLDGSEFRSDLQIWNAGRDQERRRSVAIRLCSLAPPHDDAQFLGSKQDKATGTRRDRAVVGHQQEHRPTLPANAHRAARCGDSGEPYQSD